MRCAPNFRSFGYLSSSRQKKNKFRVCKNIYCSDLICLFCWDLLTRPNDIKFGAHLIDQITYHAKDDSFSFFIFFVIFFMTGCRWVWAHKWIFDIITISTVLLSFRNILKNRKGPASPLWSTEVHESPIFNLHSLSSCLHSLISSRPLMTHKYRGSIISFW